MLFVIQRGYNSVKQQRAHNIIYVVSSVQNVIDNDIEFIYTDGHATNKLSSFYSQDDISSIEDQLDFEAIETSNWKSETDLDLKRKKEAEFLIASDLPTNAIIGYGVYDEYAKKRIIENRCK